jgi:hypothetical protein
MAVRLTCAVSDGHFKSIPLVDISRFVLSREGRSSEKSPPLKSRQPDAYASRKVRQPTPRHGTLSFFALRRVEHADGEAWSRLCHGTSAALVEFLADVVASAREADLTSSSTFTRPRQSTSNPSACTVREGDSTMRRSSAIPRPRGRASKHATWPEGHASRLGARRRLGGDERERRCSLSLERPSRGCGAAKRRAPLNGPRGGLRSRAPEAGRSILSANNGNQRRELRRGL